MIVIARLTIEGGIKFSIPLRAKNIITETKKGPKILEPILMGISFLTK